LDPLQQVHFDDEPSGQHVCASVSGASAYVFDRLCHRPVVGPQDPRSHYLVGAGVRPLGVYHTCFLVLVDAAAAELSVYTIQQCGVLGAETWNRPSYAVGHADLQHLDLANARDVRNLRKVALVCCVVAKQGIANKWMSH